MWNAVTPPENSEDRGLAPAPPSGATGQLPGRRRRAPDYRRDVAERDGENVMQDEREPFGGRQRVQDDQEHGTDRVRQQRFLFWIDTAGAVHG